MTRIRSNTGRTAAWRSVWSWPLHSRARAGATGLCTAAALLLIGHSSTLLHHHNPTPAPAPAPPAPAPARPPAALAGPAPPAPPRPATAPLSTTATTGPPANPEAIHTGADFATAWATHTPAMGNEAWRSQLGADAMPELTTQLADTDPASVPARHVHGPAHVDTATPTVVVAIWPTDGPPLQLTLVPRRPGDWKVLDLAPGTA